MPDWLVSIVVAGLISALGLVPAVLQRRRDKADIAKTMQEMATQLAADCASERTARRALEIRLDEIEAYIDSLLEGIRLLIRQLEDNHLKPCWKPGERPKNK